MITIKCFDYNASVRSSKRSLNCEIYINDSIRDLRTSGLTLITALNCNIIAGSLLFLTRIRFSVSKNSQGALPTRKVRISNYFKKCSSFRMKCLLHTRFQRKSDLTSGANIQTNYSGNNFLYRVRTASNELQYYTVSNGGF